MIRKHRSVNRLTALIVSAVMVSTGLPSVAFAVEEETSEQTTATTQNANEDLEKAKKAETSAKKERDEAFAAKPKETKKAYEDAKAAYDKAKDAFDKAEALLKTKTAEDEKATAAKKKIEGEIKKLKEQKEAAQKKEKALPSEIKKAKDAAADAKSEWKKDKEAADKVVREAQAASDAAGKEFINKKINEQVAAGADPKQETTAAETEQTKTAAETEQKKEAEDTEQKGTDLDAMIAACKTYESVKIDPVLEVGENKYATLAEIANSESFEELVKRGCRYENLKKSLQYIKEANTHRNLEAHKAGELKISYQLMGTAIISGAIGVYQTEHGFLEGDKERFFWKSGNATSSGENLAADSISADAGWDPFHEWYYEERIAALAEKDKKQIDQELIDQVLKESETNGFKYDPYKAPWNQSKETYLENLKKETGHYSTLTDSKYKATGFAYIDGKEFEISKVPYVAVQEFNTDTSSAVTVEEYEKALEEWFEPYLKPLETAKANRKALDKKPEALTKAKKTVKKKTKELEAAKKTVKDTKAEIKAKEKDLEKATAAAEKKQKELNTAQKDRDKKKTAMDKAKKTMGTKEGLNKKAQSLDPEKPSTYSDFSDLKKLVDAYEKAKKAREEAEKSQP